MPSPRRTKGITLMKKLIASTLVTVVLGLWLVTIFGDNIKALFGMSADGLAGDTLVARRTSKTRQGGLEKKTLQYFGEENSGYGDEPPTFVPNPVTLTAADTKSTFAIDVDTASWTWARRSVLDANQLPTKDGIRLEEWVNAFDYELAAPQKDPIAISVEGAVSPFDESKTLVKVALKGRVVTERQPAHLVFLVDVSGSMNSPDRLPLAKHALRVLTRELNEKDTVSLVTYAGSTQVVLPATNGSRHDAIIGAIDSLGAGGGTAMGSGMELAYRVAVAQVAPKTTTRVIVLTDGDTNIGPNLSSEQILDAVHAYVEEGVTLTTVGFGMGDSYRGNALERMADKGNGQALYFSNEREVQQAFSKKLTGTLEVVAKDVKVQVTFDPAVVSSYRLLGYENRAIADEDFKNDRVDAGEMGAGHAVTALYEVTLTGKNAALGTVAVRGVKPNGERFELSNVVARASVQHQLSEQSSDFRFATALALGADTLRGNTIGDWSLNAIAELASGATQGSPERAEYVAFLRRADQLRNIPVAQRAYAPNNAY
ncbi:MAG: von Willebrand factor type A domain-containing protein [Archangium sp.]|nr:von Willebrand factor type A domain-containing protein [Archangium sp.]